MPLAYHLMKNYILTMSWDLWVIECPRGGGGCWVLSLKILGHGIRYGIRCLGGGHSAEAGTLTVIGIPSDDIAVPLLVLASIPNPALRQTVQAADRRFGNE